MENIKFNSFAKSPLEKARNDRDEGREVNMGEAEWLTLIELKKSIEATRERIRVGGFSDSSILKPHLDSLLDEFRRYAKESIVDTYKRIADHRLKGIDFTYLEWHIDNIKNLLFEVTGNREIV